MLAISDGAHSENIPATVKSVPIGQLSMVDSTKIESTVPYIGQSFDSVDEGEQFYFKYAHHKGFNVRKGSTVRKNNELKKRLLYCCKQGLSATKIPLHANLSNSSKKPRKIRNPRTGCEASITLKLNEKTGKWNVHHFNEVHNHDLIISSKQGFVIIKKEVPTHCRNLIHDMETTNNSPAQKERGVSSELCKLYSRYSNLANVSKDAEVDAMNYLLEGIEYLEQKHEQPKGKEVKNN
ncbi:hypothetical protein ZOSMA_67G00070 [Zostera marina]|uniref:FAR1 domain-containing protein n=1 Tax=Zostera marina TaxID=29655 RepID=A0A0K9NRW6_ZOSMR|nr:hypothetical protein ZOSMA_67G00070 [Zostera marina]